MVPFQPSEYKEDDHFLRQHVGVKEPRGVQVDTDYTEIQLWCWNTSVPAGKRGYPSMDMVTDATASGRSSCGCGERMATLAL